VLRKQIQDCDEESRAVYKEKALETVDGGTKYLESLIKQLESCYKFQIDEYIGENAASYKSGMGYVTLALVSVQKIFLFLGDLARYREQINQTNNFGRAKNFYVKAQQVVPKNGRPFNQLALLAVYSVSMTSPARIPHFINLLSFQKRKIDAVYFYMRSLMSSNPFSPAKESLVALFDEIRKKVSRRSSFALLTLTNISIMHTLT
jgi:protein SMG6